MLYSKVFVRKAGEWLINTVTLSFWPKFTWFCRLFLFLQICAWDPTCCVTKLEGACLYIRSSHRHTVLWQSCCTHWLVPGSIKPLCSDCENALFDLLWTQLHPVPGTQAQTLSTSRDKCYGNSLSAWDTDTTAPTQPESCCCAAKCESGL